MEIKCAIEIADMNMLHGKSHKANIYSFFFRVEEDRGIYHKRGKPKCFGYQTKTGNQYTITTSHLMIFSLCASMFLTMHVIARVFWLNLGILCLFSAHFTAP